MRHVIVASSSQKLSGTIEKILGQASISVNKLCKSGNEVMALLNDVDSAVLICGSLKDIPAIYLAKQIPNDWDMILLLSSNQPFPYYVSNIIPINLPVNKLEFIDTVRPVIEQQSQTFASKATAKKVRSAEDTEIIERAKSNIMKSRGISESDAHKLLQHYSMNLGITMIDAANRFLEV